MLKLYPTLFLLAILPTACSYQEIEYITPQYRYSQEKCFNEISTVTHAANLSIATTSHSVNNERLKCDLDITLTNGDIQDLRKQELDSLAGVIALLAYHHISNIESYNWINVMYQTDLDGVAGPQSKGVKVFSIEELRQAVDYENNKNRSRPVQRFQTGGCLFLEFDNSISSWRFRAQYLRDVLPQAPLVSSAVMERF